MRCLISLIAFDDSFGTPSAPATTSAASYPPQAASAPAAKPDSFFDLPVSDPTPAPVSQPAAAPVMTPMTPQVAPENDLLGGEVGTLTSQNTTSAAQKNEKMRKTPTDFLGKGANLVNFDNLVSRPSGAGAINPFMSSGLQKTNPFHAKGPGKCNSCLVLLEFSESEFNNFQKLFILLIPSTTSLTLVVQYSNY